ncbi:MAG: hypothetical protein QOD71_3097 [Thermoleophilaceae bacterium]|jgi:hypothetical protein|nr:hypothetical protein [Thermoleophilaceae bacterium]
MSKRALFAFAAVFAVGLVGLMVAATLNRTSEAFTLGVVPGGPLARLGSERELCQKPIEVIETFERVTLQVGTFARAGQPFLLDVREVTSGRSIVQARVEGGYADNAVHAVTLASAVPKGAKVAVCVRNLGDRPIAPYGNVGLSNQTSAAYQDGRQIDGDMALVFLRAEPATVLGLVPTIVDRASLFHGAWASVATYWVLLVVLLVGPPLLGGFAVRAAFTDTT